MIYPKNIEEKIGFDKIREILSEYCLSPLGRRYVEKMQFSADFQLIERLIRQTQEFRKLIVEGESFPSSHYIDVTPSIEKGRIEGVFLSEEEFLNLKLSLETILQCISFLKTKGERYPSLSELAANLELDAKLPAEIGKIIDENGSVKDSASPELRQIRNRLQQEQSRLRRSLNQVLQRAIEQGFTTEDASLTIRNGRMVIPVSSAYKRAVKGFIHDESATGQTVYIEPEEALETNNAIRELLHEERREIIRLLTRLTDYIRPSVQVLLKAYQFLGIIDFIRAKARLAVKLECEPADLADSQEIKWDGARHPLLFLSHSKAGKKVIPLSARLNPDQRILVVSGPNAGGKSVCLKTFALLQYMLQCGLMIPVRESSKLGIFKNLFIDIGDEQSIENDLSTYSSHLNNMKHFVNFADSRTLFLIDEFGSGTDPQIGGAMAEAILESLHRKQAYGVITTHYSNLKRFAEENEGVVNGAMRFDMNDLEPLFELEIGRPGSSFAIEIARKIGLPKAILNSAKEKIGVEQVKMEQLLGQLESEKRMYDQKYSALRAEEIRLKKAIEEYETLKNSLETDRKSIINKAKEQAQIILQNSNQLIENAIRQIKESAAEKEVTRQAREKLEAFKASIRPEKITKGRPEYQTIGGDIAEGDWVKVKGQDAIGQVVALHEKHAEISIGELKSKIKTSRLEKITRKEVDSVQKPAERNAGFDYRAKAMEFSTNLDVRGKRTDEALPEIDSFIDDAILLGQREVRIIHGKGDGILRKMIRQHLKGFPMIASIQDEHVERGGAGVTVVTLN